MKRFLFLGIGAFCICALFAFTEMFDENTPKVKEKVLICGVCRNIERAVEHTIENIELLGSYFEDYAVIIYENNSDDATVEKMKKWAAANPKVQFISEYLEKNQLPVARTEKIARARNIVLTEASNPKYSDYRYLIMADLDFRKPWPMKEITNCFKLSFEWDCLSANGVDKHQTHYWDRYALRYEKDPLGPELCGENWWLHKCPVFFEPSEEKYVPNYSAFGGMAIYKTAVVTQFRYSGIVTPDLEQYYKHIIARSSKENRYIKTYLKKMNVTTAQELANKPLIFEHNAPKEHPADYEPVTCCEHIPLHASMALAGYNKFYINAKMFMQY